MLGTDDAYTCASHHTLFVLYLNIGFFICAGNSGEGECVFGADLFYTLGDNSLITLEFAQGMREWMKNPMALSMEGFLKNSKVLLLAVVVGLALYSVFGV